MRVFVTGSTGFVGAAVVKELLAHGHSVLGLTRKGADQLKSQGAEVLEGSIEDMTLLKKAASECDAVAHLAFVHDFTRYAECCAIDRAAIEALANGLLEGKGDAKDKALVITSGTMMLPQHQLVDEATPYDTTGGLGALRGQSEAVCLDFAKQGLRTAVVRLPPSTHGPGVSGFAGILAIAALQKGSSAYIGEGQNKWCAGHRDDAAKIYRLAIERGEPGRIYHAVAEESLTLKDVATEIGKQLDLPVISIKPEDADAQFGAWKFTAEADNFATSNKTREQLGWTPTELGLIEDMTNVVAFVKNIPPGTF
ncbi:putative oxidoreductase [Xylariaceae sp. FL0255]|nr:putative oxidoreductase [Xylariaceae sp. FL0255]